MNNAALYREHKPLFAVAPMIDWTDRHCRAFHRCMSARALLYTEMVVADAILNADPARFLKVHRPEQPVALQLGGSDPVKLYDAVQIAEEFDFDEINLNVGCPSDRVQSGTFGACLMRSPQVVGTCIEAMKRATSRPVTIKCRLGVDDQDIEGALNNIADAVIDKGVDAIWVHARKAWLDGLSPKENRDIPPLDYARVYRLKERAKDVFIGINGGIKTLDEANTHLEKVDGVMMGREAYQNPAILLNVDTNIYQDDTIVPRREQIVENMISYIDTHLENGGKLGHITRHMIGLYHGFPGARRYRQVLSSEANKPDASADILRFAAEQICELETEVA